MKLSVVIPLYNEAGVLEELVERCDRSARSAVGSDRALFELILVDDDSTDDTPVVARKFRSHPSVRYLRLRHNVGQFRTTQSGLRAARGEWIVVLDGDLQDPPEVIPDLVQKARTGPDNLAAVFAVKTARTEPAWFNIGQAAFHFLQSWLGAEPPPKGAGSFCAMRRGVASRVSAVSIDHANLAPVVARVLSLAGADHLTVPYEKARRYDDRSRVGPSGLVREAVGSLLVSGALTRLAGAAAVISFVSAVPTAALAVLPVVGGWALPLSLALLAAAAASGGLALYAHLWNLRFLSRLDMSPPLTSE